MSSLFNIAAGGQAGGFYDYQIDNSLRNDSSANNSYLEFTPTTNGDRKTWTWSGWFKRTVLGDADIFGSGTSSSTQTGISFVGDDRLSFILETSNQNYQVVSSAKFRDVSSWYHIVVVCDTTDATGNDRMKIYVNGERLTELDVNSNPTLNFEGTVNSTSYSMYVSRRRSDAIFSNLYFADVNLIDGQALDPTSFGETKSGVWIPKDTSGLTFGTNGFRLEFGDSAAIGDDTSGNGNDFTVNNLSAYDVVPDSPTLNYATANVLAKGGNLTLAEGNLRCEASSSTTTSAVPSTIGMTTGKWYAEYYIVNPNSSNARTRVGISSKTYLPASTTENQDLVASGVTMIIDGQSTYRIYENGTLNENSGTVASGDIIGIAFDADAQTVEFYLNGVQLGTNNPYDVASVGDGIYYFMAGQRTSADGIFNFGQDSTFAGATTAGGNSDENGYGDFKYSVPSGGFLALNSANLPEPSITPLDDEVPEDYFNTVLYDGASAIVNVTGVGFSPEFLWIKRRNASSTNHKLLDIVRGSGQALESNNTGAESDESANFSSFDSDGFTLANVGAGAYNVSGGTFVSWSWLANGTAVSNTDGSITSSVSANTKAGFSIVTYTGNSSSTATVGHGLGVAPKVVAIKSRNASDNWQVSVSNITGTTGQRLYFNLTQGISTDTTREPTKPSSSVISIGGNDNTNGRTYVAYCFAEVEGYSKFGSYTGNGSTDGTFVYTGFRPAWVMIKQTNAARDWWILDNKRDPDNVVGLRLRPNASNAEEGADATFDYVSNGFKIRGNYTTLNASGGTYIYMAFAEMPTKYANAR